MTQASGRHTDHTYEEELEAVRQRLLLMAGRVEKMIGAAARCLVDRDADGARSTILGDHAVNQDEIDVDALCIEVLARRQPMASDLRFITQTLKMVADLERIADLAVNVCERAIDLAPKPAPAPYVDIPRMADVVQGMVHDAIDAFVERDEAKANRVRAMDDEVDDLYRRVFTQILELMAGDKVDIHDGIHIQSVAKYLERMGDHATNLAEEVLFMIRGRDVRHEGKL